ncbi:LysR substrate-binding domain-containing protein [Flavisphingomonas formosensis]|uniref:LysR substrate-binding domain-containing protein n=1 Tax=Flavisphingomonas formosensis TaxID=861534 RepID=UPI0012FA1875|nr:LysR substrate-binding domain-containing protein [Sphingomonas formosensis]
MNPSDRKSSTSAINPPSRKALPPFEALRAFDAVARLRGIRKAAQSLGRDHAVVSRHLRAIERWTGTTLIERSSGGVTLTEDGKRYHKEIGAALDSIALATIDLMRRGDHHRLHIWSMPGFALHWLSPQLGAFEKAHPGVDIELRPTDRSPDFSHHETDIDIRFVPTYGEPFELAPGLRSVEFARVPIVAVASRAYLDANPPIRTPADLVTHRLLHEANFDSWANWLGAHGVYEELDLTGPLLWQGHLTLDAAKHDRGVALANHLLAGDDLRSGQLVEIGVGEAAFQPYSLGVYHFITRADRWDQSLIRRFRLWLTHAMSKIPPLRGD